MSFTRVDQDGVWFSFARLPLLLAVVLCGIDQCFDSWVFLGLLCFLRVTQSRYLLSIPHTDSRSRNQPRHRKPALQRMRCSRKMNNPLRQYTQPSPSAPSPAAAALPSAQIHYWECGHGYSQLSPERFTSL